MKPFFILGAAAAMACASAGAGSTSVAGGSDHASVFLDGQSFGDLSSLRNIAAPQIRSIQFIRGTDAVTTYGMQYGAGVIDIRTK